MEAADEPATLAGRWSSNLAGLYALHVLDSPGSSSSSSCTLQATSEATGDCHALQLAIGPQYGRIVWLAAAVTVTVSPSELEHHMSGLSWTLKQIWRCGLQEALSNAQSEDGILASLLPESAKSFVCAKCSRRFHQAANTTRHMTDHHAASQHDAEPVLKVRFEDDYMAVVVKPDGIATMGKGSLARSSVLMDALNKSSQVDALSKAAPTHRLDAPTGGLLVVGKTRQVVSAMGKLFEAHKVTKRYRAIVAGDLRPEDGIVDKPVGGLQAVTRWAVVSRHTSRRFGTISVVDLWPESGRKHQLRRHMAEGIGHAIVGDSRYGGALFQRQRREGERMCLWALEISLAHPVLDVNVHVLIEEPLLFAELREREEVIVPKAAQSEDCKNKRKLENYL